MLERISELDSLELKVTENAHRNHSIEPWEEGSVFTRLLKEKYGGNLNALSESLGKSTTYIKDRTRVFHCLHPSLRRYVGKQLTVGNAISLAKTVNPER